MRLIKDTNTVRVREKNFYSNFLGHYNSRNKLAHLRTFPIPMYPFFTASMNPFEKYIFKNPVSFDYHLSGYGNTIEEANISLMGESVERFAFVSQIKYYNMVLSSYQNMKDNGYNVEDFEYINIFSVDEVHLDKEEEINWVEMNYIKKEGTKFIPAQLVMPNISSEIDNNIRYILETVSTGTAAQESIELALENAIYEVLQLDSFNMWWYMGYKSRVIDIDIKEIFKKYNIYDKNNYFFEYFNITVNDISFDKSIYVIAVEIESKVEFLPKYTVGLGSGSKLEHTIYRAILECMTIVEYNCNTIWIDREKYLSINNETNFNNLDSNVIYYSKYGKPKLKFEEFSGWNEKKVHKLKDIIETLPDESFFHIITPPDFIGLNNEVVRVVIPSMLPMAIPQSPPINHPRYLDRGIINKVIHPLP